MEKARRNCPSIWVSTHFSARRELASKFQPYDLRYWKRRGTPRFFRYATIALPSMPTIIQAGEAERSNQKVTKRSPALDAVNAQAAFFLDKG